MTVGVPVTVHPGTVTELYPDNDGSPSSAPGLTRRFGLSTVSAATGCALTGVRFEKVWSISRRTQASRVHSTGSPTGGTELAVIDGPEPTHPSRVETTLVTMFNGASGPLNGAGSACGVIVSIGVTATVIGDDAVAGAERVKVRSSGLDVVSVNRNALGDCTVEALLVGLSCGAAGVEADNDAPRDDFLGATSAARFGGDAAGVLGAWSWSSVVGAEPSVLDSVPFSL
jgi:hypothetical protein